jgi:hypothetical protein
MTEPSNSDRDTGKPGRNESPADIFARLEKRGIDYTQIKVIVQLAAPQYTLLFAQWFKGRTISKVLKQLDEWKGLLKKDLVLSLNKDLKQHVEQSVLGTELMVWLALIEANPQVGPWDLQIVHLPSSYEENGRPVYAHPAREIRAVHRETKETRNAQIAGGSFPDLSADGFRRAFEQLKLWDHLWKGDLSRPLISRRAPQGWPVFTRLIVPRLYDFMAPYYEVVGHHWARHGTKSKRPARYPKDLLNDMLEVLRLEFPHYFHATTLNQLTSTVQGHLKSRR